uniref:Interferon alpha inducible protein 27 like 2 n=1 Tax=Sus scrofa TaxID=9823 RepID=A0A4X1SHM8_PIG
MMSESCFPVSLEAGGGGGPARPQPKKEQRLASFPRSLSRLTHAPSRCLFLCVSQERAAAAAIGGALAVGAVPVVLGALGFTGAGIAASSLAAKMMSAAAVANGGGVAAGSLVATLQSVGAAGLSTSSNILLGSVGSAFGAWLGGTKKVPPSPPPAEPRAEGGQPGEDVSQAEPPNPPHKSEKLEK